MSTNTVIWEILQSSTSLQIYNTYWLSLERTYLTALITLIAAAPTSCTIQIQTPNKQLVDDFNKLLQIPTHQLHYIQQTNHWITKRGLRTILAIKDITIEF